MTSLKSRAGKRAQRNLKLGVIGCGAIGSRIALSVQDELRSIYAVKGLFDIDTDKARALAKRLGSFSVVKASIDQLISSVDVVVEAVNTDSVSDITAKALMANKTILAMSVGKVLRAKGLFDIARSGRGKLLLPSGAIAGLDAIKAASLSGLKSVTLTTRKPPEGFAGNMFLHNAGIDLDTISTDTVLFEGGVSEAVKRFPQNINVAATLALAAGLSKVKVCIVASPGCIRNSHEVLCESKSGTIRTITENIPCPDNAKTSYLAVLSGIQVLKELADRVKIGT